MSASAPNPVGILGGGRWGLALACAVARNGHPTMLHSRRADRPDELPADVAITTDLGALARHARLLLVAVPSAAMAVTWPSWTVLLWTAVWVVALFLAALLWETTP